MAFSANVGGTGTLIGTGDNLVLKGEADEYVFNYKKVLKHFLVNMLILLRHTDK